MRTLLRALIASALLTTAVAPAVYADGPTINGSGSTWSAIAIDQWRADVGNKRGLTVNYNSVGSSSGRQYYIALGDQTDFAVSEIPFVGSELDELKSHNRTFQYLPIVAGGTAMMYNLKDSAGRRIRDLRLSPDTITGIFTGAIKKWNDPKIAADYGRPLPDIDITPVIRSDGSGTSAQFAAFMAHESKKIWSSFAKQKMLAAGMPVSNYPDLSNSIAQKGSDGIANYVANPIVGLGAIGYLESSYAVQRNFPVVAVKNHSGKYVLPTSRNVATALTKATLNADRTQNLEGVYTSKSEGAYPISSYSYMIVPNKTGLPSDKTAVLGKFMLYFACEGQRTASLLGYSPLPKNLVSVVFDAVRNLPAGRPTPPDLTFASCGNPTLRADGDLGEGADILRGSLPYGSNGDVPATNQTGNGTGSGLDTTDTGTSEVTGNTDAGGSNSGVYSALQPTKLTVNGGAGTGLTFTAIAIGVAALAPLAHVALRRRRAESNTSE